MGELADKVTLVTGSNGGIGFATAELFAKEGASVYVNGRRRELVELAASRIGPRAIPLSGDVSQLTDLDRMFEVIAREHGKLDIVVANAAIAAKTASLLQLEETDYRAAFDVNVKSVIFTVQKALPLMPAGGAIVIVGSVIDLLGIPGRDAVRRVDGAPLARANMGSRARAAEDPRERRVARQHPHGGSGSRVGRRLRGGGAPRGHGESGSGGPLR